MSWMAITRSLFGLDPVVCPESAEDGRVAEATPPPIHKLGRGQDPLKFDWSSNYEIMMSRNEQIICNIKEPFCRVWCFMFIHCSQGIQYFVENIFHCICLILFGQSSFITTWMYNQRFICCKREVCWEIRYVLIPTICVRRNNSWMNIYCPLVWTSIPITCIRFYGRKMT